MDHLDALSRMGFEGGAVEGLVVRLLAPSAKVEVLALDNVERPLSDAAGAFQQLLDSVWKAQMRIFDGIR